MRLRCLAPRRSGVFSDFNNQKPERVALQVIAAICDIFSCGPEDLITVTAADVRARKTGTANSPKVVDLNRTVRPRRARIIDDDH
ncbi:hypothetical protein ABH924_000556 [Arthrobacter sp. GAS37]|uniref:helix-turn-helix domain-containing protein n=1 Tax=Arthrobacter sp. GAS37 TaxID=3156261 RepID=UPI0038377D67